MKFETIILEQHLTDSRKLLKESCEGLTTYQRTIVEGIYKDSLPLIETTLTAQQIQSLFGEVEKAATAAGGNRTMLGKGVDVAKKADETLNKIGKWLQNTTPVQGFDQKFEGLKAKIAEKFPELAKQAAGLGELAKANPGKTAAIVGILTTIAAFAGGPVGGAIAGQILRGSVELLKGEKLSTAIGKGIKTAAYGAIAGWLARGLGDWLEGLRADVVPYDKMPGIAKIDVGLTKTLTAPGMSLENTIHSILVPEDSVAGFQAIVDTAKEGDINAFNDLLQFVERFSAKEYLADKAISDAAAQALAQQNDAFLQTMKSANDVIAAAAQGAATGKLTADSVKVDGEKITDKPGAATESWQPNYYVQTRPLTEGQVHLLFRKIQQLDEAPMDLVKKAAGYVSKKATNLTTKVTADKLSKAWQKAGSPTDSEELAKFLKDQGVVDDIVIGAYQTMKLPAPGTGAQTQATDPEAVKTFIAGLSNKHKGRLINWMEKNLKVA